MTDNDKNSPIASNPFNYRAFVLGLVCSPVAVHFLGHVRGITGLVSVASVAIMFVMGGLWGLLEKLRILKPSETLTPEQRIRRGRPAQAVLIFIVGHGIGFAVVHFLFRSI